MYTQLEIHDLQKDEVSEIGCAFENIGWSNRTSTCETYFNEQSQNIRSVLIARLDGIFCAYVTIKWQSNYLFFIKNNIPEISDLNVIPTFRHHGIGTKLISICEERAKTKGFTQIGLGVGMTVDYGSAQRLYVQLGYIPDGHGMHYKNKSLNFGDIATVDDDLVLYLTKKL